MTKDEARDELDKLGLGQGTTEMDLGRIYRILRFLFDNLDGRGRLDDVLYPGGSPAPKNQTNG